MKKLFTILAILLSLAPAALPQANINAQISDSAVLRNFFDGLINGHLKSKNAAGAVVAVVSNGKIVFSKGYGYADFQNKLPVSPDSTLFRIGSISKTFTWTAVMQLVEQGKLNLDEDINVYLKDLKIPEAEGGPITLRHLMTHTPGFEDRLIGIFSDNKEALKPFGEILAEQLPERVRPAGTEMSYSNHGTGIAAHIVEQVSGLSWDDYVERYILQPLGMNHTTFRQPLPDHLAGMESKGYNYESGALREYPFEYVPLSAVGGASSTATDISRFMIAHLQHGTYNNVAILDSASSSMMQGTQFKVSPYVSGIGLGLYELVNWNGIRTLGHGGDTFWFHSLMALIPELNLGVFVSFNTQTADYAQVFGLFMDHFFPLAPPKTNARLTRENSEKYTGEFRFNRYPRSDMSRLFALTGTVKIGYDTAGYITTRARDVQKWYVVNDSTFIKESGDEYLVFGRQVKGKYTFAVSGNLPVMPFERVPLTDSAGFNLLILAIWMIIVLLTFSYWPAAYLIRKRYTINEGAPKMIPPSSKWTAWTASFLVLLFITCFIAGLIKPWEILYGIPPVIKSALVVPLILCIMLPVIIYQATRLTLKRAFSISGIVHLYMIALALILLLWQLNNWNLLGFKY